MPLTDPTTLPVPSLDTSMAAFAATLALVTELSVGTRVSPRRASFPAQAVAAVVPVVGGKVDGLPMIADQATASADLVTQGNGVPFVPLLPSGLGSLS